MVIRSNSFRVECLAAVPTGLDEGSRTDTIKKVNLHPYRSRIQRSGESAGGIFMDLAHNHFQDYINLLEKRKLKLMHTAANLDGNSGNSSEVSALKVLVDGMLAWREIEAET